MTIQEYANALAARLEEMIGGGVQVSVVEKEKPNGVILTGLRIKDRESNVDPCIYVNATYEEFDGSNMEEQVNELFKIYRASKDTNTLLDFSPEDFTSFEGLKERVSIKLINTEQNKAYLENKPNRKKADLSEILIYPVMTVTGRGAITLLNDHLKAFTAEQIETLFDVAENRYGYELSSLSKKLMGVDMEPDFDNEPMVILTNYGGFNGAAAIASKKVMEDVRERLGRDFYIIPSSIHEVILVDKNGMDVDELKGIIQTVNATELLPEEVLSDNAYVFEDGELKIAA